MRAGTIGTMLQQGLYTGHSFILDLDLNVAPRKWMSRSCKFASCSVVTANLGTWEERLSSIAECTHGERRLYILDRTLLWVSRQSKWRSCYPYLRSKESRKLFSVNKFYKPAFVVRLGRTRGSFAPTSNLSSQGDVTADTCNQRMWGSEQSGSGATCPQSQCGTWV
eukprot:TRINITY_DN4439_c0_g1_i2.p1 TRINITY_DN4439_c0_g1~~TRINITY_DN4439_c0_g1_i2.p1  ORF type:complete len:166 (+),score=1.85 TRINITY_DN4439_c0_g1_i2:185-682(+)